MRVAFFESLKRRLKIVGNGELFGSAVSAFNAQSEYGGIPVGAYGYIEIALDSAHLSDKCYAVGLERHAVV